MRISSMRISSFFLVVLLTNHFAMPSCTTRRQKPWMHLTLILETPTRIPTVAGKPQRPPGRGLVQSSSGFDGRRTRPDSRSGCPAQEWMGLDKITPAIFSDIVRKNNLIFYMKTLGGENVGKLYVREAGPARRDFWLIPPLISRERRAPSSPSHRLLTANTGLGFSAKGAGWPELRVLDVQTGKLLPDTINPPEAHLDGRRTTRVFL